VHGIFPGSGYWLLTALLAGIYAMSGLYPGLVFSAVLELRRLSIATTLVYLLLLTITAIVHIGDGPLRAALAGAWLLSLFSAPLARSAVRHAFSRFSWWGVPVVAFASAEASRKLVAQVLEQPEIGLKIVAVLDNSGSTFAVAGVPVIQGWEQAPYVASELGVSHAVVSTAGIPSSEVALLLQDLTGAFTHLFIMPDLDGFASIGIEARDLCRNLTLEVRNNLLLPWPRLVKRIADLVLAIGIGVVALPLVTLIALAIRIESPGPAFYRHRRIGRYGAPLDIVKFRTMVCNGDQVLEQHLERDPEARREWRADRKLRADPRVTRVGRLLRKTSLDELPQLWNVLLGEMSVVGPRPIVSAETAEYGNSFGLYLQVRPGLTGLWQVSGRNDTTYAERVALDTYYVRNWSPWLDTYLLARTVLAVLHARGAY
jgi:Undecaprenyl-phosphate galactose phosphotransferase WbaP